MSLVAALPLYVWLPVLFVVTTPVEAIFIIFLISRLGGWGEWARRFPAGPGTAEGAVYPWCSARLGKWGANYGKLLAVTVSSAGLRVAPRFITKLFHPPLQLPWSCVRSVGESRVMGRPGLEVNCEADGNVFRLFLPPDAAGVVSANRPAN